MVMDFYKNSSENSEITMHLDYDKTKKVFYTNIYFSDCNHVIKTPLVSLDEKNSHNDIEIEKFNITKYSYLSLINSFRFY